MRAVKFTLVAALGVLAFAAYHESMDFSELSDVAVRTSARFWDWLGVGAGTGLVYGHAFRDVWDRLLGLLPQEAAAVSS